MLGCETGRRSGPCIGGGARPSNEFKTSSKLAGSLVCSLLALPNVVVEPSSLSAADSGPTTVLSLSPEPPQAPRVQLSHNSLTVSSDSFFFSFLFSFFFLSVLSFYRTTTTTSTHEIGNENYHQMSKTLSKTDSERERGEKIKRQQTHIGRTNQAVCIATFTAAARGGERIYL